MYLFRGGDVRFNAMDDEQSKSHLQAWNGWMTNLSDKGVLIEGVPLSSDGRRVLNEGTVIVDGVHAEGHTSVGGYVIIKANTMDEAVSYSKDCPIFQKNGEVEIRQIKNT